MEIVPQRDAATLLSLINTHVASGTFIRSDELAAYNQVERLSMYPHMTTPSILLSPPLVSIHRMSTVIGIE